jgi:hypothetical protein
MASAAETKQMWLHQLLSMTHGLKEWGGGSSWVKEQERNLSVWNAVGLKIPRGSSREKLCLNPTEGWVRTYWHSKHLCFCKEDKRESASLPQGMIYGLLRHWVWAAVEGMVQGLMDEGWGNSLGNTLIKIFNLSWTVEENANAILHVDVKDRQYLEGTNLLLHLYLDSTCPN